MKSGRIILIHYNSMEKKSHNCSIDNDHIDTGSYELSEEPTASVSESSITNKSGEVPEFELHSE